MARSIVPTRVSQVRSRYPLREFTRSGVRSPKPAPQSASTSALIRAPAKLVIISRNRSASAVSTWLRNQVSASMLDVATVVSSRLVVLPQRMAVVFPFVGPSGSSYTTSLDANPRQ